jgi:hypothetical protein
MVYPAAARHDSATLTVGVQGRGLLRDRAQGAVRVHGGAEPPTGSRDRRDGKLMCHGSAGVSKRGRWQFALLSPRRILKTPPTEPAEGVHLIWSTRPGSLAGFARFAIAERSSAANRRPPRWQETTNPKNISSLGASYRQISAQGGVFRHRKRHQHRKRHLRGTSVEHLDALIGGENNSLAWSDRITIRAWPKRRATGILQQ